MRILEVAFHLAPGGVERFVVDLSNELAKKHDVTLLVLRDESINNGHGTFYKNEISSVVHYQNLGLKPGLRLMDWWKIWNSIRTINPEIVHFHGEGMPFWMIVPIILSSSNILFFQTIHSDIHNRYDKGFYKKVYMPYCAKSKKVKFIALSDSNYKDLVREYPYLSSTCIVNGRAPMSLTGEYSCVKMEIDSLKSTRQTKIFIHVGRCSPEKNQERLIKSFNKLIADGYDCQLLILGSGFETELGQYLKSLSCDCIHFLGTRHNIADYQKCSDLFCLSSNYEGMPITLLEALMCGTPVVSTPVCGAIDAIRSGENGIIADGFSDTEYYEALKTACIDIERLKMVADMEKEKTPYGITACADKYEYFFKSSK